MLVDKDDGRTGDRVCCAHHRNENPVCRSIALRRRRDSGCFPNSAGFVDVVAAVVYSDAGDAIIENDSIVVVITAAAKIVVGCRCLDRLRRLWQHL